jgi:hypothetical protein
MHRKVCRKITTSANLLLLLFFLFPSTFFLATPPACYGRGESGVVGTPLVRGRGESGVVGTPLAMAMAAFVAAMATIVTIKDRKRRAFDDINPPWEELLEKLSIMLASGFFIFIKTSAGADAGLRQMACAMGNILH